MTHLNGIVLGAGEGKRMGGTKSLLVVNGAALVEHHVARLIAVGCTSIAVVVRPAAVDAVRTLLRQYSEARAVAVTTSSQADSLAAGVRWLDAAGRHLEDVLVITPVDLLPAKPATYQALLAELNGATLAVTPQYGDRGGHPVIVRRALLTAYDDAQPGGAPSLRDVLNQAGALRRRVQVDDRLVLGDFDTPADLVGAGAEP